MPVVVGRHLHTVLPRTTIFIRDMIHPNILLVGHVLVILLFHLPNVSQSFQLDFLGQTKTYLIRGATVFLGLPNDLALGNCLGRPIASSHIDAIWTGTVPGLIPDIARLLALL
jgi:hypothetical protein